jgi:hypothetical protein
LNVPQLLQQLLWSVSCSLLCFPFSHTLTHCSSPSPQKQNGHDRHIIEPISPYTPIATALTSSPATASRSSAKKIIRQTPPALPSPPSSAVSSSSSKRRSYSKLEQQQEDSERGQEDDSFYNEIADQLYDEQIRVTHLTGKINELHRLEEEQRERVKELAVERDRYDGLPIYRSSPHLLFLAIVCLPLEINCLWRCRLKFL